ncbi:prophage Lp3 protein 7 [Levilactobacillus senmaizukei DSM 21775 = NBRC 103853]|uniref:Prophage Lp3 protein 7 n=1 Tax=Levilactobacillus senmaizukei DSM 21775 = NBRC 103853 TaxID=1423803 RepID=A0A0R2DDX2_9LACO|nr:prophage Lp3 protein 7 [Levilactobacillus senmaizukei DSM 21775 = NBRC 103853]
MLPMVGKQPLIKFADKPALTPEQVQKFWMTHPYSQIALRTTNFFVVDIDEHPDGADGFKSFREFEHPEWFRDTLSQTTAGGGRQLFYLKRDTNMEQNIGWLPGIDVKAHVNNYVVVAPSERGGHQYKWENNNPIVTASPELVASINQRPDYKPSSLSIDYDGKTATAELFETISKGLGDTGGRNNALASFSGGLLIRGVDPESVLDLAKIANARTPDSLTEREVIRTVESMVKKEIRRREAQA